jgi:hypothetical protein
MFLKSYDRYMHIIHKLGQNNPMVSFVSKKYSGLSSDNKMICKRLDKAI